MPISTEPLQQPEKLKEETRASAAGDTQDEVLVEERTDEGAKGQKKEEILPFINIYAHRQAALRRSCCQG